MDRMPLGSLGRQGRGFLLERCILPTVKLVYCTIIGINIVLRDVLKHMGLIMEGLGVYFLLQQPKKSVFIDKCIS